MFRKLATNIFDILLVMAIAIVGLGMTGNLTGNATPSARAEEIQVSPLAPTGSGFTYQGRLSTGGSLANGQYDLTFSLWDAASNGTQIGITVAKSNQTVSNGLFTVSLDFGGSAFQGSARWLEMSVRQAGIGNYTTLTPRQPLAPAPYAMSLMPGAVITGTVAGPVMTLVNSSGGGLYVQATGDIGVQGVSSSISPGVDGTSNSGVGVFGHSTSNSGVMGVSNTGAGLRGASTSNSGVFGSSTNDVGVEGVSPTNPGVYGHSTSGDGVWGQSISSRGLHGQSETGQGVEGFSNTGTGVYGSNLDSNSSKAGVYGNSLATGGNGVIGEANYGSSAYGVWGKSTSGYAGFFSGNVRITGTCCAAGMEYMQIDHPLDPANKYLNMATVASPDMMNIQNGNATTDAKGEATITLPDYFEALNSDYRYQLTVMGQFAQAIVLTRIKDNHFTIKTDKPNVEVSWQVTGVRHDPYATQHPLTIEQTKSDNERGFYLHPELYGQPDSKQMDNARPGSQTTQSVTPVGHK